MRIAVRCYGLPISLVLVIASCSSDGPSTPPGEDDQPGDGDGGLLDEDGEHTGPTLTVCFSGSADHQTIGEAIAAAPDGAVLAVCAGTYNEQLSIDRKPIAIRGIDGADVTILDAGGAGVALDVRDTTGAGLEIEGLTIRGGDSAGSGGGISCDYSGLRVLDSVVRDNRSGGGAGLYASNCELDITRTAFTGNQASNRGGGALLVEASGFLSDSSFEGNQAVEGAGLAIVEGWLSVRGNQFSGNAAGLRGGAIFVMSDATVEENVIADNTSGWTGGGIHVVAHAPLLRANQVRDNVADDDGGGIYVHQGTATIMACDITGNRAGDDGGGIRLFESSAKVSGNRIIGNVTADGGGGIRVSHVPSLILDNEIRDNEASMGGGIDMDNDSSVVRGGIIADNRASWAGGGIAATIFPWLGSSIEGVRITGNQASDGGGMYMANNFYPLSLTDVELTDNVADRGAGIFVRATNVSIKNTLIARNQAWGDGGGIFLREADPWTDPCPCPPLVGAVDVAFVVIHANQAAEGSAVWADTGGLSVSNSILSSNPGMAVVAEGAGMAWTYNDTTPASFAGMANPTGSSGNISVSPEYADAAFRLATGSPCINAGDPSLSDRDGSRADMGRFGGPEAQ